jgi:hypothetical protein
MLPKDVKKRLFKHRRKIKLIRRDKEDGRIINKRQTTCKWIDNQQPCKRENKTIVMDITE